jgi:hypothetical protein
MRVQTAHNRIDQIAIFVIALLCYAWFFPRWADPNQNSRLNMVVAVVDDGTFTIDKYVANTVDYAKVGNHYYSDKAPGTAFLGIPIYAGLRVVLDLPVLDGLTERLANSAAFQATLRDEGSGVLKDKVRFAIAQIVLSFITNALPTALMCALLYVLLLQWGASRGAGIFTALAYGLLTPAFAYANSFYGHQLSAALLFIAFYLLYQHNRPDAPSPSWFRLLSIGLLLGYSVVTEYPSLLIALALLIYAFFVMRRRGEWRRIAFMLFGLAFCAAVLLSYNTVVFGGPFKLGYGNSELWTSQHSAGFMSLTYPHIDAVWGITFGLFRGLFILSPVLLLALPGFVMWHRSRRLRPEFAVALFSVLAMFLFNASSIMWWGGFAIGPRYLLPGLPFMALAVAFAIDPAMRGEVNARRRAGLALAVMLLGVWSLAATWGMTLAEQAFPSDAIRDNPYVQFALPNWLAGNIARNLGTIMGLRGLAGLLPLLTAVAGIVLVWGWLSRRASLQTAIVSKPATPFIANQSVESV